MATEPFENQPKTWVIVGPKGLYYVGLHEDEDAVWRVAFGWPDDDDIQSYKLKGFYAAEATLTWKQPVKPCEKCGYQYGHQIGCANNPVDQALLPHLCNSCTKNGNCRIQIYPLSRVTVCLSHSPSKEIPS